MLSGGLALVVALVALVALDTAGKGQQPAATSDQQPEPTASSGADDDDDDDETGRAR
jgi:hypothetical protein